MFDNFSHSLGQFHYQTDGFRDNNDLTQDIYNVFVQASASPKLSVQAEATHREVEHGDLLFDFDLDEPSDPTFRRDFRADSVRVGAHYTPAPHSDFVASWIYQDTKSSRIEFEEPREEDSRGYLAEAQYLYRSRHIDVLVGGGFNDVELRTDFQHGNGYAYSYIRYPADFSWTIGVSVDEQQSGDNDLSQANPKIGLMWDVTRYTTLRLAAFRTLKRSLLFDPTIEPTHVSGFNQFFDDPTRTDARRYGIAIDQKFSANVYGGLEISKRDLFVPRGVSAIEDWDEELLRAYLDWTPHPRVAISTTYQFENFENESDFSPPNTVTHLAPLTLSYFDPSGFFADLRTTYVNQGIE
ncbi:MAG: hypothetical protein ACREXR_22210, partial [Gammaproteobacteria bacterium]